MKTNYKLILLFAFLIISKICFAQLEMDLMLNELDRQRAYTMLELVNKLRAEGCVCGEDSMPKLEPLSLDYSLMLASKASSYEYSKYGFFGHCTSTVYGYLPSERIDYFSPSTMGIGENIAEGALLDAEYFFYAWKGSTPHCKVMMSSNLRSFGYNALSYRELHPSKERKRSDIRAFQLFTGDSKTRLRPESVKTKHTPIIYGPSNHFWTQATKNFFWWELINCEYKDVLNDTLALNQMKKLILSSSQVKEKTLKPILFTDSTVFISTFSLHRLVDFWGDYLRYKKEKPIFYGYSENKETKKARENLDYYHIKYFYKEGFDEYFKNATTDSDVFNIYPVIVYGDKVFIRAYDELEQILNLCLSEDNSH